MWKHTVTAVIRLYVDFTISGDHRMIVLITTAEEVVKMTSLSFKGWIMLSTG